MALDKDFATKIFLKQFTWLHYREISKTAHLAFPDFLFVKAKVYLLSRFIVKPQNEDPYPSFQ